MAISNKTKDQLKKLNINVDELIKAIQSKDEIDIDLPNGTFFTDDELSDRDANVAKELKKKNEGEALGILKKELSKKLGLDVSGDRIGDVVEQIQAKIGETNDEKVKTLQEQVTLLSKDKENFESQIAEKERMFSEYKRDATLRSYFPQNRDNRLSDDEYITLLKNSLAFEEVDGKLIGKKGNDVIKDPKTHAPLEAKDVINSFFTERNWITQQQQQQSGGRGIQQKQTSTTNTNTLSAFKELWRQQNPDLNPNGAEFLTAVSTHYKNNPNFNMDE